VLDRKPNVLRVFPRKTRATPIDDYSIVGWPSLFFPKDFSEIHISIAFSWDLPFAFRLKKAWESIAPTKVGGPATGMRGDEFIPGMYLRPGYVITSRGCPNKCWFCEAWKRDGDVRELPITDGWNLLDDNLLACSEDHIHAVFEMLKRQPRRAEFTGGLESTRLKDWHIDLLAALKPKQIFFSYDSDSQYESLVIAGQKLIKAGFTTNSHTLRCYVLVGFPEDSFERAENRLVRASKAGFLPMAMLFRHPDETPVDKTWRKFQRQWARPILTSQIIKELDKCPTSS